MNGTSTLDLSQLLPTALAYVEHGLAVIPLNHNSKIPALLKWTSVPFPTEQDCKAWFGKGSTYNIGIRTGKISGIFVVDIDIRHGGMQTWETLKMDYLFDDTEAPCVVTPSGGLHLYYRYPETLPEGVMVKSTSGKLGPGIDIRGEGGQVVAPPSLIDRIPYRWKKQCLDQIPKAPQALIDIITASFGGKTGHFIDETSEIPRGQRDDTLVSFCGVLKDRGLSQDEIHTNLIKINENRCKPPLPAADVERIAGRASGWAAPSHVSSAPKDMPKLRRNKFGIADGLMSNLSTILHYDLRLKELFKWNELDEDIYLVGKLPWEKETLNRRIEDHDYLFFKNWLCDQVSGNGSGHRVADPNVIHIREAISVLSHKNKYHPIRNWLSGLAWDGVNRIDSFCTDAFGVEPSPYYQIVGKILLYGSIARVLFPGCKFDYMPIISGKQGILKSTFIKKMFGPWSGELSPKNPSEIGIQLHGKWVAEDAELICMKKFGDSFFKAWISEEIEEYRPLYGRHYKKGKKGYIIIGTTNKDEFLNDPSGGRRFLPIYCGNKDIDLGYVDKWRNQLFAEAKAMVLKVGEEKIGDLWTGFDKELSSEMEEKQETARVKGNIEEVIISYLNSFDAMTGKERLTNSEITIGCIKQTTINGLPILRVSDFAGGIIWAVMKARGWVRNGNYWVSPKGMSVRGEVVSIKKKGREEPGQSQEESKEDG